MHKSDLNKNIFIFMPLSLQKGMGGFHAAVMQGNVLGLDVARDLGRREGILRPLFLDPGQICLVHERPLYNLRQRHGAQCWISGYPVVPPFSESVQYSGS